MPPEKVAVRQLRRGAYKAIGQCERVVETQRGFGLMNLLKKTGRLFAGSLQPLCRRQYIG